MPDEGLLEDFTILDLTEGAAGPFATKLLADYGARVVKVERPQRGDPARRAGSFGERSDAGALFLYLNTGKESITLDLATTTGRLMLLDLAEHADAVIESRAPGELDALGLGERELHQRNPRLIVTSVTAFGQSGPYASYRATDLTAYAAGGQMSMTGDADREPLMPAGRQAAYQTGMHAFGATLAGLFSAGFLEIGQHIDIATMECLAATLELYLGDYVYFNREILTKRRGNIVSSTIGIFPCADGYAGIHVMPRNFASFVRAMDAAWMLEDERFKDNHARLVNNDELLATVYAWAATHTREEIYARAGEHRTTMAPVLSIGEAIAQPHFRARESFRELDGITYPGPPFRPSDAAWELRPAPRLGEHNADVYHEMLGMSKRDLTLLRAAGVV